MKVVDFATKRKKASRKSYKDRVLDAFDRFFPQESEAQRIGKKSRLDTDPDIRRKAKEAL